MGFAVMLVRAERAGREFTKIYLRRILALAVFGAVHYIYLWEGDILFSYAVAALALLIVLYGRAWPIVIACAVLVGLGFIPEADLFFRVAGGLAAVGLLALYLRGQKRLTWRGISMPVFCFLLMLAGVLMSIAAVVFWLLPDGPTEPRVPLSVCGPLLFVTGGLSWKYPDPTEKRSLRMAVSIYVFAGVAMTDGPGPALHAGPAGSAYFGSQAGRQRCGAGHVSANATARAEEDQEARAAEMKANARRSWRAATRKVEEIRPSRQAPTWTR